MSETQGGAFHPSTPPNLYSSSKSYPRTSKQGPTRAAQEPSGAFPLVPDTHGCRIQPSAGATAARASGGTPAPFSPRRTLKGSRELLCSTPRVRHPMPGVTPGSQGGSRPLPQRPRCTWDLRALPTTSKPAESPRQRRFLQALAHPVPRKGRRQRGATYAARARLPATAPGCAQLRWQRRASLGSRSRAAPPLREPLCPAFPHVRAGKPHPADPLPALPSSPPPLRSESPLS